MSTNVESVAAARRKRGMRAISHEVTFGRAYDGRLVRRLSVFFRPHFALFVVSMLTYPVVAAFGLAQPYLVKVAIDQHLVPRQLEGFGWIAMFMVLAVLGEFVAKFTQTILSQLLGQRVCRDLRVTLFRRLQTVDLSYIERNPVGRLMTRVTNDVESLQETFSTGAISIVGDIVTLVGIVAMMLALDWKLTLYAFATLPLLMGFVSVMRARARDAFRRVRTLLSQMNAFLNEAIQGMTLVQAFRQERNMHDEFSEVNGEYRNANFLSIRYDAMTYAVVEGLSTVATASILLLGLSLFINGSVEIGLFVAFVEYLRRFFMPINELSTKYTVLQSAMASAERCVDLLDQNPAVIAPKTPVEPPKLQTAVRFDGVTFSYGPDKPKVFEGLDLELRKGEKVAIVGPTGAGKSTIVKLFARFYDPTEGRIIYDDVDVRDMAIDDLRGRLAVVLQDPYLLDGTIEENIRFGHADVPHEALERAAERTQASKVIARQRDGWQTR
ncbi:MAG: ABC transporter ATP-binding protein, partial [Myxococcota bacterium]